MGYCQYSKPANTEDTLKWAFKLFDRGGKGRILLNDLIKVLRASLDMTPEETTRIFKKADQNNKGYITYGKSSADFLFTFRKAVDNSIMDKYKNCKPVTNELTVDS